MMLKIIYAHADIALFRHYATRLLDCRRRRCRGRKQGRRVAFCAPPGANFASATQRSRMRR